MVITKPLKVLVCLAILVAFGIDSEILAYNSPDATSIPGIQGDALSAEPKSQSIVYPRSQPSQKSYSSKPVATKKSYSDPMVIPKNPISIPYPAVCPPTNPCSTNLPLGPFGPPLGTGVLPRIGCKQFQLTARLWYAKLNNSKIIWGTDLAGGPGTELDLHNSLGLRKHEYVGEYEARCQVRPNWGLRYSFMPIAFRDNFTSNNFFFFGNALYPAGLSTLTKWDRNIHRWDLVYDWYQQCHAVSSIFAGYALYDDKLTVSNVLQSRSRSRGFGLAFAGLSIERIVKDLRGATASINCKWSLQFLEGYFGWDGYAAGRISVPMGYGRFGYLEAGWRWIVLRRDYPSDADKTNLDGLIGAVGMVF